MSYKGCVQSDPIAAPFENRRIGIFHFRRVIPVALRPFFDGRASQYRRTLDTGDPDKACQRYHPHAILYEQKLAAARRSLASKQLRSARTMVDAYLDGVSDQQLQGMAQNLASLELGAFRHAHGLTDHDPGARYGFGNPPERTDLQNFGDRKAMLEAIPDISPQPWLETLQRISTLPSLHPVDWASGLLLARAVGDRQRKAIGDQSGGRVFLFLETDDFARDHLAYTQQGIRFVEAPRQEPYGIVAAFEHRYGSRSDLIEPVTRKR